MNVMVHVDTPFLVTERWARIPLSLKLLIVSSIFIPINSP